MQESLKKIAALLQNAPHAPLLYRGSAEREFLKNWISAKEIIPAAAEIKKDADDAVSVKEKLNTCVLCKNIRERKMSVGSGTNGLMIILNAPDMITELEKKLYKADAVALFKKMVTAMNVAFEECYITNMIKCETDDMLARPSAMFLNCEPILVREIEEVKPSMMLVMGDIMPLQKIRAEYKNIPWFAVDHPMVLLKNPDLKKKAWSTMQLVMSRMADAHA